LLFNTNLIIYDRRDGTTLYPRTRVIEKGLYGIDAYTNYPYGDNRIDHQYFLFDLVIPLRINGTLLSPISWRKNEFWGYARMERRRPIPLALWANGR